MTSAFADAGRFGPYGGAYIPETLVAPVAEKAKPRKIEISNGKDDAKQIEAKSVN